MLRRNSLFVFTLASLLVARHQLRVVGAAGNLETNFVSVIYSNASVAALLPLPDGKFMAGGNFNGVGGFQRGGVARLNADGSVDTTFVTGTDVTNGITYSSTIPADIKGLARQADGKIIVVGSFLRAGGLDRTNLVRLNTNGTVDTTFSFGIGPDKVINVATVLTNGQILVGGQFTKFSGTATAFGMARLNSNGTVDTTYTQPSITNSTGASVGALATRSDGRMYIFQAYAVGTTVTTRIVRLNPDGILDSSFPSTLIPYSAGASSIDALSDGGILVGTGAAMFRYMPDGTLIPTFQTNIVAAGGFTAVKIVAQPDGRIILPGTRNNAFTFIRVQADGTTDTSWSSTSGNLLTATAAARQSDGRVLVAGYGFSPTFSVINTVIRLATDPAGAPTISTQPKDQAVTSGLVAEFNAIAQGTGPFSYQWQKDGVNITGAVSQTLTVSNAVAGASYRVIVSNANGSVTSSNAVLTIVAAAPGSAYRQTRLFDFPNGEVSFVLPGPAGSGKTYIAGPFSSVGLSPRRGVARFNADGTLDTTFDSSGNAVNMLTVRGAAVMPDGGIVIDGNGGVDYGGLTHTLIRFGPDGKLDTTFGLGTSAVLQTDFPLLAMPDGKILASLLNSSSAFAGVSLINSNGTKNTSFNVGGAGFANFAYPRWFTLQPDGKILVAVKLDTGTYNGQVVKSLVRLAADGTLDTAFNSRVPSGLKAALMLVQTDGKILVCDSTDRLNEGIPVDSNLKRLNADGTLDTSFDTTPIGANDNSIKTVASMVLQPDGRILVSGFLSLTGVVKQAVARLNTNGRFDSTFNISYVTATQNAIPVMGIGILREGALMAGGDFQGFDNVPRTNLVQLVSGPFTNVTLIPPTIADITPPQVLKEGGTATFKVTAVGLAPFRFQWFFDGQPISGAISDTLTVTNLKVASSGRYYVAVVNDGGTNLSNPNKSILLVNPTNQPAGLNDRSYKMNAVVAQAAVAYLANGKRYVGGTLQQALGVLGDALVRLNEDGSLDTDFSPAIVTNVAGVFPPKNDTITAIAVQPDGKVLIGGAFDTVLGQSRSGIARVNADGTLDASFVCNMNFVGIAGQTTIVDIEVLSSGNILVSSPDHLVRLSSAGIVDKAFTADATLAGFREITVQPDGKIIIPVQYGTPFAGFALARLTANGALDSTFGQGGLALKNPTQFAVDSLLQPDGKIVTWGYFLYPSISNPNVTAKGIIRLNADGSLDNTFNVGLGATDGGVISVALQPDGKLIVSGQFNTFDTVKGRNLIRLNPNGSPDLTLLLQDYDIANTWLEDLAVTSDNKINHRLGRLHNVSSSIVIPAGVTITQPVFRTGTMSLAVSTETGKTYALEYKRVLSDTTWTQVASVTGDGASKSLSHTPTESASGFYRIRIN